MFIFKVNLNVKHTVFDKVNDIQCGFVLSFVNLIINAK